ncbi:MAG: hypothetical protein KDA54_21950 [Phycisphaerales bacterium]|nr:hypothetical protein [Phycisphaerales bacterium]
MQNHGIISRIRRKFVGPYRTRVTLAGLVYENRDTLQSRIYPWHRLTPGGEDWYLLGEDGDYCLDKEGRKRRFRINSKRERRVAKRAQVRAIRKVIRDADIEVVEQYQSPLVDVVGMTFVVAFIVVPLVALDIMSDHFIFKAIAHSPRALTLGADAWDELGMRVEISVVGSLLALCLPIVFRDIYDLLRHWPDMAMHRLKGSSIETIGRRKRNTKPQRSDVVDVECSDNAKPARLFLSDGRVLILRIGKWRNRALTRALKIELERARGNPLRLSCLERNIAKDRLRSLIIPLICAAIVATIPRPFLVPDFWTAGLVLAYGPLILIATLLMLSWRRVCRKACPST